MNPKQVSRLKIAQVRPGGRANPKIKYVVCYLTSVETSSTPAAKSFALTHIYCGHYGKVHGHKRKKFKTIIEMYLLTVD